MAEVDGTDALRQAAEALRLCHAGEEAAGLALYRTLAKPKLFRALPLGLHAHLLDEAGRHDAASSLRRLALRRGGDLAWRRGGPEAEAAEYEALFARGIANPVMAGRYVSLLTELGRTEALARMFDPDRLFCQAEVDGAQPAAAALLAEEADVPIVQRCNGKNMRKILALERRAAPFDTLLAACRTEAAAYLRRWAASDHPLARAVPEDFRIEAWALISRGEGYHHAHHHPIGWATGVYYPVGLPDGITGGELRVGGWDKKSPPGWPDLTIRPRPGLLVLMPSYYVHWTDQLSASGLRLSIAFDAIPRSRGNAS